MNNYNSITARKDRGYHAGVLAAFMDDWPLWCPTDGDLLTAHDDPAYAVGFYAGWHGKANPVRGAYHKSPEDVISRCLI